MGTQTRRLTERAEAYLGFRQSLRGTIDDDRLFTDPLRTLAYGSDASVYRLIPRIVIKAAGEAEIAAILRAAHCHAVAVTFRAAGTSLSLPVDTPTLRRLESSLYVDIGALRAKLDWTPPFGVDEGLRCMLTPP